MSIRPFDLVRLRETPAWSGQVLCIEAEQAFVHLGTQDVSWVKVFFWAPVDLLELVPGQWERLVA